MLYSSASCCYVRNSRTSISTLTQLAAASNWSLSWEFARLTWVLALCGLSRSSDRSWCWWGRCMRKLRPLLQRLQSVTSRTRMCSWTWMMRGWQIHRHLPNHLWSFLRMCKICAFMLVVAVIKVMKKPRWCELGFATCVFSQIFSCWLDCATVETQQFRLYQITISIFYYYYYNHLMASFPGQPG